MEELVVLLQAAIETANVERWALEHGEAAAPAGLKGLLRKNAYEVTVVDAFHRLARRQFERLGYVGVWERPLLKGTRGRPKTIDVSLFDITGKKETRIELGLYDKSKLRSDAQKLREEADLPGLPGYVVEANHLLLWQVRSDKTTDQVLSDWIESFVADALEVSSQEFDVRLLLASTVDLFAAGPRASQYAVVGLFEVVGAPGQVA
jgi:hypothetical protein